MKIGCPISIPGARDNGTWSYIRHALKHEMGLDVIWHKRTQEPPEGCDFYLFVDDGIDQIPMNCPKPNACYLIDSHLGHDVRREWANHFDTVFCAQKDFAEELQQEGLNAHWLPLACSPKAHPCLSELLALRKSLEAQTQSADAEVRHSALSDLRGIFMDADLTKEWDVTFVGYMNRGVPEHPQSHDRVAILDKVFKAFPNSFLSVNTFHEQMAARYVKGRVGFNVSILSDLNMRAFEIPSTGTVMLANRGMIGLEDVGFVDGVNYVGYDTTDEAIEKCRWMLAHPTEREEIAQKGHVLVRSNHTYRQRCETMLRVCGIEIEQEKHHGEGTQGADG